MMRPAEDCSRQAGINDADAMKKFRFIFQVHASVKRHVSQKLFSTLGVTYAQASALVLLTRGSEVSCQELAMLLGCGTSRISRLIQDLERRQLLACSRRRVDRRELQLAITAEGAALAARVPAVMQDAERVLLRALPDEERRFLCAFLSRIVSNCNRLLE